MDPVSFRKREGWTQAQLGERLGLGPNSKGYVSRLEKGAQPWPLELALKFQQLSEGVVPARELCPDRADLLAVAAGPAQA